MLGMSCLTWGPRLLLHVPKNTFSGRSLRVVLACLTYPTELWVERDGVDPLVLLEHLCRHSTQGFKSHILLVASSNRCPERTSMLGLNACAELESVALSTEALAHV